MSSPVRAVENGEGKSWWASDVDFARGKTCGHAHRVVVVKLDMREGVVHPSCPVVRCIPWRVFESQCDRRVPHHHRFHLT